MNKIFSEQSDWDELLEFIAEKQLTPVIGREVYKFTEADGLTPFDEYLSKQILKVNGVTDLPPMPLTNAVSYLVNERRMKTVEVTRKLKSMVKEVGFDFPLLTKLLEVTELNYFINTSVYDNVLEQKLKEVRGQEAVSINFSINEPFSDSEDVEKLTQPLVFNVFGSLLHTVDHALSEEDMLEYTGYFKEKMNGVANLANALRNHNLLFVGCAFPDWMVRFVLRLLSNEPLHEWGSRRSIMVVNDNSKERKAQFDYLQKFDVSTYEGNTADFVQEFSARWKQKNPAALKTRRIFLSYTINDRDAVEKLKQALEDIPNISCWYDKRDIAPGDDWRTEIAKNLKSADLCIPLISANSLQHKDGYVQEEWRTADNVNTFRKIDGIKTKYLMPVVIDDTNPYDASVPRFLSELSIGKVPDGNPGQEFINQVRETLQLV